MNGKQIILIVIIILLLTLMATKLKASNKYNANEVDEKIIGFESFRSRAYIDDNGNTPQTEYSIGYGSQYNWDEKRPVRSTDVIDRPTALRWLQYERAKIAKQIDSVLKIPQNANQMLALISFTYNEGFGAFKNSTMLKKINRGDSLDSIASEFDRWIYVTRNGVKVVEPYLRDIRRPQEKSYYLKPM